MNLMSYAHSIACGDTFGFDEYHFGFGQHESGGKLLFKLLWTTSPGWAILCIMVSGFLFLILKGRRLGRRLNLVRQRQRRSKLEYVHSVGSAYTAVQAWKLILKINFESFCKRCAQRAGLPSAISPEELARYLSKQLKGDKNAIAPVFHSCREAISDNRKLSRTRALFLFQKLGQIEQELFHADFSSQSIHE